MKKKSCFLLILIIIFIFFAVNITRHIKIGNMPIGSIIASNTAKPFVYLGSKIKDFSGILSVYFGEKVFYANKIEELEKENIRLRTENDFLKEIAYKEQELEKLLDFNLSPKYKRKGVKILYYSPTHWYKKATINAGLASGIKIGSPVVDSKGLLGQVCEISNKTAIIESITNEKTAIGGQITGAKVKGLIIGDGSDTLIFTYLKFGSDIKVGDIVSTYGDGSLIPSNIPVGEVREIKEDKLTNSVIASLKPVTDFNSPSYVNVIVGLEK